MAERLTDRPIDAPTGAAAPATLDGAAYAEQRFFAASPFNLWITSGLLYAALIGGYAVATAIDHGAWITTGPGGAMVEHRAWIAMVLALIVCSNLALQRFSRQRELVDAANFRLALKPGYNWETEFSVRGLRLASLVGVIVALAIIAPLTPWSRIADWDSGARLVWFVIVSVVLSALFFRGLALTTAASRHSRRVIETGLTIDLLNIERLHPWGRFAARTALIWFTVSASSLLLFVGSSFAVYLVVMLVGSAAIRVFVGTLSHIHRAIRAAKRVELDRLRVDIANLAKGLEKNPAAAPRLTGLLAYEARIAGVPEWPFDQTILVRLGVSSLILTAPWFGQAFAAVVVEHLGRAMP